MNAHLGDAVADRCDVAWIAESEAIDAGGNLGFGANITKALQPVGKDVCLADFNPRLYPIGYTVSIPRHDTITIILPH